MCRFQTLSTHPFIHADNFELTGDDEITLKGFLDLHVMTAEDEEGGETEIWDILNTMGYNKQLQLDQVTHYVILYIARKFGGELYLMVWWSAFTAAKL